MIKKNKVLQFLRWLIKRKIMHQNRHDVNTYVKLSYTMRNKKSSYSIISITITSSILFTCDRLRNDTHLWLWGRCVWRYIRIYFVYWVEELQIKKWGDCGGKVVYVYEEPFKTNFPPFSNLNPKKQVRFGPLTPPHGYWQSYAAECCSLSRHCWGRNPHFSSTVTSESVTGCLAIQWCYFIISHLLGPSSKSFAFVIWKQSE
jgi:hypothetical protein